MTKRLLCILATTGALLAAQPAAGQTTVIPDETRMATGELTDTQKAAVDEFVESYAERMTDAASDPAVLKSCRQAMISAYSGGGEGFVRYFADATERLFVPVALHPDRPPAVQVNAAAVVAEIARPAQAPLLAKMLDHPTNPAVHYYGVKGFDRIAPAVVAAGEADSEKMFATLEAFAKRTRNPALVRVLAQALDLSELDADAVNPRTISAARDRAIGIIINDLLAAHLQAVRDGDAAMADAATFGVDALASMGMALDDEGRKPLLGAIANVAGNAAAAFEELSIVVSPRGNERLEQPAGAVVMLLVRCERAVRNLTGSGSGAVSRQLPPGDVDAVRAAATAMRELVGGPGTEGDLQKLGIPQPMLLPRSTETAGRE